jgi:molybdate transport system permease protein
MSEPQNGNGRHEPNEFRPGSDTPFLIGLGILGGSYAIIILAMIMADLAYVDSESMLGALRSPEIHYSIVLSLLSCTLSTILSLWVAIPLGYLTSRFDFPGKRFLDTVLDIPIVLPPLVIGISLLALFNFAPFSWTSEWVVFEIPAVILAQFMVACAFATRAMRISFDQIPERYEKVALTLGCNRGKAFWLVVMPQTRRGIVAAGTLAWARSLGEFGPILVFAGSTRMRTEVLPTSVYLEIQAGNLKGALAVSLIMIVAAAAVLATSRLMGMKRMEP